MRSGYPPAIVHSTERQRYYEALKGANPVMNQIVQEAIENNLASIEKMLDAYEAAREGRPAVAPTSAPAMSNGASLSGSAGTASSASTSGSVRPPAPQPSPPTHPAHDQNETGRAETVSRASSDE